MRNNTKKRVIHIFETALENKLAEFNIGESIAYALFVNAFINSKSIHHLCWNDSHAIRFVTTILRSYKYKGELLIRGLERGDSRFWSEYFRRLSTFMLFGKVSGI